MRLISARNQWYQCHAVFAIMVPLKTCKFLKKTFVKINVVFRWFKFTLKPPYTVASGNLLSAIWDTSHWTSFVKFGLKTA